MDTSRLARFAPITGLLFFVFVIAGAVSLGDSPDFAAAPEKFTAYYTDDKGRVLLGSSLTLVSLFFLIWFVGTLTAAARRAEGGDGRVSRIAFGGGMVGAALLAAGTATNMMAALRVDEQHGISDDVAVVYGDLQGALGFIAGPIGFAALLAGIAVVNSRTPFLPRWLTWVSALMALGSLISFVAWAVTLALPLWCAVVGSLLYFQAHPDET